MSTSTPPKTDEKDEKLKKLRDIALADAEKNKKKNQFGMFSADPPLCLGDDTYEKKKIVHKDEMGRVLTNPRNFAVSAPKQGKINSSYFSPPAFLPAGKLLNPNPNRKTNTDKPVFRPNDNYKTIVKTPYTHESERVEVKKTIIDKNGRVITEPANFRVNPSANELYKPLPHMQDEYDRVKQAEKKLRDLHHELIKEKPPFKITTAKTELMGKMPKPSHSAGSPETGKKESKRKKDPKFEMKNYPHENPFKPPHPTLHNLGGTFDKYPEHKADPIKKVVRREPDSNKKDNFKINSPVTIAKATPSITLHPINIKRGI